MRSSPETFIRAQTRLAAPVFVPEVRLHLGGEPFDLWRQQETALGRRGLPVPFWAFAWPGGLALARYVLDHPATVAGRAVLDLATGSGLVAIAAARAGARSVRAVDADPYAVAATRLNAEANGVAVAAELGEVPLPGPIDAEVVLAGDVCYETELAERVLPYLDRARLAGAAVLVGDPERAYLPRHFPEAGFRALATYDVPVAAGIEDTLSKRTTIWEPTVSPPRH